jgi:hypothetical protein
MLQLLSYEGLIGKEIVIYGKKFSAILLSVYFRNYLKEHLKVYILHKK